MAASSLEKTSSRPAWGRCRLYWLLLIAGAAAAFLDSPVHAQKLNKANYFSRNKKSSANHELLAAKRATAGPAIHARHAMYEVIVESTIGEGVGLYTVKTGRSHPLGPNRELLGGGSKGLTGTSYNTIRSYNTNTDYVQTEFARGESPFNTIWLDSLFISDTDIDTNYVAVIRNGDDTTGVAIRYLLPNLMETPDNLRITQRIFVRGTNFDNSWVEITTIVANTGAQNAAIGIRYFWDMIVAGDDGPVLAIKALDANFGQFESAFAPVDFAFYSAAANNIIDPLAPA
ncbi:MAG: hypothetical protein ACREOI_38550, partial [bacterium]